MDGINNIAGSGETVLEVGGKRYTFSRMLLADYAERERYILSLKPNPFEVLEQMPETLRSEFFERAWNEANRPQFVTMDENASFDASLHGTGWRLWRALRGNHPEIDSVQAALDLIEEIGTQSLNRILDALDGVEERDILPNSDGQAQSLAKKNSEPAAV